MVLNYTIKEIVVHGLYSSDPFSNNCYEYIYGRSALDATEAGCNYYWYTDFTFSDDTWTIGYATALDNTGSDSDSVCGSFSGGEDDDDNSGEGFGSCDYLECLQTEIW